MAHSSAATHLNVTRESRTFLCRFVNESAECRIKRRLNFDVMLRQMVLIATMPYANSNAVCRGDLKPCHRQIAR
jgi:hypothetical protein